MSTSQPSTPTTNVTYIRYNGAYIHTKSGLLKLICIVLNLVGFICIQCSLISYHSRGSFFSSVAMIGFWFTGILLALYLFQVVYKVTRIPWLLIEMWFCVGMTLFYVLAASLAAALTNYQAFTAAAFFGYLAMIAYGYDAFLKYKAIYGATVVMTTTTTTTTHQVA